MMWFRANLGMLLLASLLSLGMAGAASPADPSATTHETIRSTDEADEQPRGPPPSTPGDRAEVPAIEAGDREPTPSTVSAGSQGPLASSIDAVPIPWVLSSGLLGAAAVIVHRSRSGTTEPAKGTPAEADPDGDPAGPPPAEIPEPGTDGLLRLGRAALDRGDLEAAIGWFETAIAVDSELEAAHFCMGLCLDELGRVEVAADVLGDAHGLAPGDPMTRYALASALARTGRPAEAIGLLGPLVRRSKAFAQILREDAEFDALRDDPRFLALTGELDLDPRPGSGGPDDPVP